MSQIRKTSYKEILKQNEKKSYADYISQSGIRAEENYYDTIKASKTEKALASTDYGVNSSKLSSMGLSESGYEDYLKNTLESQYKTKTESSHRALLSDEYKNKKGYEAYVSSYKALQEKISQSVIDEIGKGNNFSYENAYDKAVKAGVSEDLASYTASRAVSTAINNTIKEAVTFAKANNLSPKTAKDYAKSLGLDEIYAEKVYNSISTFTKEERDFYSSMTADTYYDYIMSKSRYK